MAWHSLSYGLLRAVLSRDRAKAVLGDITEELAHRGALTRRTAPPGIRLIGHTVAFIAGMMVLAAAGRGRRMLIDDVRHVWRRLRARPGAAVITAALLAAAIGLSTGTFAVLDSFVLERAPFSKPETLRAVGIGRFRGTGNPELINLMRGWRDAATFEAVEAAGPVTMGDRSSPTTDTAALVTPGLFPMLGVRPIRGRGFSEDDARGQDVEPALIAARIWRTTFGGDEKHLGNVITLHGQQYRLIGVMPDDFRFPESTTVLWRPISFAATPFPAAAGRDAYVRLPSGIPEAEVMQRATHLAGMADGRFTARPNELVSSPIGGVVDRYAGRAIPMFAGAVGLIFLSLCANASGLRLANMTERRRELGVRLSLGASRLRLLRELTLEHACIGVVGVVGGIGLANLLTVIAPPFLSTGFTLSPTLNPIDVDGRALMIASALGVVAVVLAGLLPAWIGTRVDPALSVKGSDRTHTESRPMRAATRSLLVAQIAFASMLVVGAVLLLRSFETMATTDRGMNARGVYTMNAFMSSVAPGVLDEVDARLSALPGVEDAVVASATPPQASSTSTNRWSTEVVQGVEVAMRRYDVRSDFFDFFGITLLRGRLFQPGDSGEVAIISERVAALLWPNADPLGKVMRPEGAPVQLQVIGVTKEITIPTLAEAYELPEIYLPHVGRRSVIGIGWRCFTACPDRQQVTAQLRAVDPKVEAVEFRSTEQQYARELVRPRAAAELGVAFATIGFITSGAGLFAVFSYAVGRRQREFGIRTALGATPARLRRGISGEALKIAAIGIALGGLGAWALHRALASVIYGVSAWDPAAWLAMIAVVTLTTLIASYSPSRRASRVDPVQLLREE